ncbi:MAG: UDP-N-acetylmuramate dehydrogenase [Clostridiales Family XIII bacterium]|nr:UDP-N-acetylmuramate dehydrogenase [Clostridiales Family XIII bacterium]
MRAVDEASERIGRALAKGWMLRDAPMRDYTSFRAGGRAACLVAPYGEGELGAALEIAEGSGAPWAIMGNGSNILVRDGGFSGIIIKIGEGFESIRADGCAIHAGAGALLSDVADAALGAGLTGFEFAAGIPGSLGGAVCMNAGAYGGEMSGVLASVRLMGVVRDGAGARARAREAEAGELGMSYRRSSLQAGGVAALGASIRLSRGDPGSIRALMSEYARIRAEKQPLGLPSAGSFFRRPEGNYAGRLIQEAGLCGMSRGGAEVSRLHAGFIVNAGGATAKDITDLMEAVQSAVYARFGVMLEPEVRIIGDVQAGV